MSRYPTVPVGTISEPRSNGRRQIKVQLDDGRTRWEWLPRERVPSRARRPRRIVSFELDPGQYEALERRALHAGARSVGQYARVHTLAAALCDVHVPEQSDLTSSP